MIGETTRQNVMNSQLQDVIDALRSVSLGVKSKVEIKKVEIKKIETIFQSSEFLTIDRKEDGKYYYDPKKNDGKTIKRCMPYGEEGEQCYSLTHTNVSNDERNRFENWFEEHQGLVVNQSALDGSTLLCTCAELGKTDLARWVIEQGANVNLTYDRKSPLWRAVQGGHPETVEYLLSRGAGPIETPLRLAYRLHKLLSPEVPSKAVSRNTELDLLIGTRKPRLEDLERCAEILERVSKRRAEDVKQSAEISAQVSSASFCVVSSAISPVGNSDSTSTTIASAPPLLSEPTSEVALGSEPTVSASTRVLVVTLGSGASNTVDPNEFLPIYRSLRIEVSQPAAAATSSATTSPTGLRGQIFNV